MYILPAWKEDVVKMFEVVVGFCAIPFTATSGWNSVDADELPNILRACDI